MERFKTLTKLNIKRAFKSLFQLIFGAIALIFIVSAIAFYGNEYLYGSTSTDEGMNLKLAVVMNDKSDLANTITEGITNMDGISSSVHFTFTDESNAMSLLNAGDVIATMIVPENTVKSIMNGDNIPIQIIFPENSGFEAIIIKEITDAAATMLSSSQAGIYCIYDFYNSHDAMEYKKDAINRMNLKYINMVATGVNTFDTTNVSSTGSIPLMTYYISGALVLFSLLLGMNCYSFLSKMPPDTAKRLTLSGCPVISQSLSCYISIVAVMMATVAIIATPSAFIMNQFGITMEFNGILALLLILPIFIMLAAAFIFFISQLTTQNMGRIMITFFVSLVMCFISGCFIPSVMLPDTIQFISRLLPTEYMMKLSGSLLSGSFDFIALFMCFVYTVLLIIAGAACAHLRINRSCDISVIRLRKEQH